MVLTTEVERYFGAGPGAYFPCAVALLQIPVALVSSPVKTDGSCVKGLSVGNIDNRIGPFAIKSVRRYGWWRGAGHQKKKRNKEQQRSQHSRVSYLEDTTTTYSLTAFDIPGQEVETVRNRGSSMTVYTHTTWHVIPGKEAEFEKRWADWADWGHQAGLVKGAKLLKSSDEEGVFVSFGVWKELGQALAWRKADGYAERLGRIQQVITSFEPRTLKQVGEA
jgi:hypothetical protein